MLKYYNQTLNWHLMSAHHYTSFQFLCCRATDVMNCSLSHHITLRRTNRTKHIPTATQICVCQLFWVCRNAIGKFPITKLEAQGWLQGVWDKHASDTLWTYRQAALIQLQQLWKHLLLWSFLAPSEKKSSSGLCGCWCHAAKNKYVIINPALVFRFGAIFMTG